MCQNKSHLYQMSLKRKDWNIGKIINAVRCLRSSSSRFIFHDLGKTLEEHWKKKSKSLLQYIVMCCAIWYHLLILKNVKNTHGGVLLLVKLQAFLLKVTLLHGCFSCFLNCKNDTKSCKASHMTYNTIYYTMKHKHYGWWRRKQCGVWNYDIQKQSPGCVL